MKPHMKSKLKVVRSGNHPAVSTAELSRIKCMEAQSEEFVALSALTEAYGGLWAVTDCNYASARSQYERALSHFIGALRNNRRIP